MSINQIAGFHRCASIWGQFANLPQSTCPNRSNIKYLHQTHQCASGMCYKRWFLQIDCMRALMLLAWETFRRLFATTRSYLLQWQNYSSLKKKQIILLLLQVFTKLQISTYNLLRICSYVTAKLPVYTVCSQFKHYVGVVNLPHSSTCPMLPYNMYQ